MANLMTRETYDRLLKEITEIQERDIPRISKAKQLAAEEGDLSENAEYDAAKQEQAMNEQKIGEISSKLSNVIIIDNEDIPDDKAYIGAQVTIQDLNTGEEAGYMLVSDAEADFMENKISVTSLVGKGLLGHAENDEVEIEVPAGTLRYKILKIERRFNQD